MATGTIKSNSEDISSSITAKNGATITSALRYGRVINIIGTIPANMPSGTQVFTMSDYAPSHTVSAITTRSDVRGVISLTNSGVCSYITNQTYAYAQNFQIMYIA